MNDKARREFDYLVYGDYFEDADGNPIDRALIELDKIQADIDAKYPKPTTNPTSKRRASKWTAYIRHEQAKKEGRA